MDNTVPSNEDVWFYEESGERKGGIKHDELIKLIQSGNLSYGSVVWKKGLPEWIKLENTELREHLEEVSPPPLQGQHINNTVVWVLSFAPIIGYFLEVMMALAFNRNDRLAEQALNNSHYFYVTLLLNIGLAYYDEQILSKSGCDTDKFKGMTWFIPVYLYQRAKYLKQNMSYFSVWLGSFILLLFV